MPDAYPTVRPQLEPGCPSGPAIAIKMDPPAEDLSVSIESRKRQRKAESTAPVPSTTSATASPVSQILQEVKQNGYAFFKVDATTPRGLVLVAIEFEHLDDHWKVTAHCRDFSNSDIAWVEAKTFEGAWALYCARMNEVGQCKECNLPTDTKKDNGNCGPCEIRAALPPSACSVCAQPRPNMYNLLCGHRLCRDCARRIPIDTGAAADWPRRKCPFCCYLFRLSSGMAETMPMYE